MNFIPATLQQTAQGVEAYLLSISHSVATTFVAALWQGAVIAVCLAVCLRFAPRASAALRFALWAVGFVLVAGLPFLPLVTAGFPQPAGASGYASSAKPLLELDLRWSLLISVLWAAASLYRAADLAFHVARLRKLWRLASPVDSGTSISVYCANLRRPVELCTTNQLDRPAVIGFFAPRILIPEWLMEQLTSGELEQIVLHESEHLRRGDDWTNLLQKISLVLFPLNPVLLWMERRLCLEREMACDDGVVRVTQAPRAYATCLTNLAERGMNHRAEALSLGVLRRRPELVQRVHSLLRKGQILGPVGSRSFAAAITCAMIFGVVELSRCPQLIAFEITPHTTTNSIVARSDEALPIASAKSSTHVSGGPFKVVYASANQPVARPKLSNAAKRMDAFNSVSAKTAAANQPPLRASAEQGMQAVPVIARSGSEHGLTSAEQQNYIVLTTWEQESTTVPGSNAADAFSDRTASRMIVTRTIFRVVPAKAVTTKRAGPNSNSSSQEPIPTLVPTRDGWLVLDL
jgi:beta-lactamase regulating signal transducer with metallopeptidase domain